VFRRSAWTEIACAPIALVLILCDFHLPGNEADDGGGRVAPLRYVPGGPSLRSKRGVEQSRPTDGTFSRAIRYRGAPKRQIGAAGTVEVLDTGLRQYQPDSKNPLAVGLSGGAETLRAGTSYRSPPAVSGRLGSQPGYRVPQGAAGPGKSRNAVDARVVALRSVSVRHSPQLDGCTRDAFLAKVFCVAYVVMTRNNLARKGLSASTRVIAGWCSAKAQTMRRRRHAAAPSALCWSHPGRPGRYVTAGSR
jgi:hypothetical protein